MEITTSITWIVMVLIATLWHVGKQHADHIRNALLKTYELTTDWSINSILRHDFEMGLQTQNM
jgi:hypothetical protein